MTLSSGTRLGPYEILALLGAGGMGEVFRARDSRLGRDVAVKLVHARFAADAEQLRRFEQEGRLIAQSPQHPRRPRPRLPRRKPLHRLELLEGESLRDKLGSPLPPKKAVAYAIQIAQGLSAVHEKGIVHRDPKPDNLFVTKDGRIKILEGLDRPFRYLPGRQAHPFCRQRAGAAEACLHPGPRRGAGGAGDS